MSMHGVALAKVLVVGYVLVWQRGVGHMNCSVVLAVDV